jgi:hypothetical protein
MKHWLIALLILPALLCSAQRVTSIGNGYWSNPSIWSTGAVPLPTDSVIIDDYVLLDTNITVSSSGLLFIDGCGVLCGDYSLTGSFTNYGELRIKTGELYDTCDNFSLYTCSEFNIVYTAQGGLLNNCCGGAVYVNYPVNCSGFPRGCNNVLSVSSSMDQGSPGIVVTNSTPYTWTIQIQNQYTETMLVLMNLSGQVLSASPLINGAITIDHSKFATGIYILKIGTAVRKVLKQ